MSHVKIPLPVINRPKQGFTLLEAVLVIAILAIVAALVAPLAVNQIAQARYDSCREELQQIKKAMVGDASLVENGSRSDFGFLGNLGVLPSAADGLEDLVSNTVAGGFTVVYAAWPQNHSSGLTWGWRGPYISEYRDPWGRNYTYTQSGLPSFIAARIRSAGADGVLNNTDDVFIDIRTDEVLADVAGNTLDACGRTVTLNTAPQIFYPAGTAVVQSPNAAYGSAPIFRFSSVPLGIRVISFINPDATTTRQFIAVNNGPVVMFNLVSTGACN